jgi:hypothetical protein
MTHAESLERHIGRRIEEIGAVTTGLDDETARHRTEGDWSAREVLLHLIGDTADVPDGIRRAVAEDEPEIQREQRGGDYLPPRGDDTPDALACKLIDQLAAISAVLSGLDDASLARPVTIGDRSGVPVGLWVRDVVGEHFEVHLEQLRAAIAQARR